MNALVVNLVSFLAQFIRYSTDTKKWSVQVNLINFTHQRQIYRRAWPGPVVDAGSMDIQQFALADD